MFTAALFTIAKTWKQPKYSSTEESTKKSERETKESIPFTISTEIIQYLGINLPMETNKL